MEVIPLHGQSEIVDGQTIILIITFLNEIEKVSRCVWPEKLNIERGISIAVAVILLLS
jgi:hypothetical protein